MRTIGRHLPKSRKRDYCALCDTCDVRYYRSQLRRCSDGMLRCFGPGTNNDAVGANALELDLANAQAASAYNEFPTGHSEGRFDSGADDLPPPEELP